MGVVGKVPVESPGKNDTDFPGEVGDWILGMFVLAEVDDSDEAAPVVVDAVAGSLALGVGGNFSGGGGVSAPLACRRRVGRVFALSGVGAV